MDGNTVRANIMLITTAMIWGLAFVAQVVGMDYIEPFTFTAVRTLIGGIILIPCIALLRHWWPYEPEVELTPEEQKSQRRIMLWGGLACGVVMFAATSLQQIGLVYTTAGKAGFITALYIVLVPIFGIFFRRRVGLAVWLAVIIAVVGLYLLSIQQGFSMGRGDLLVLLAAIFYALHILVIGYFAPKVDGVKMSCIQFFVAGFICLVPMFVFENPEPSAILSCWIPILYVGILSTGVAYTLQVVAQSNTAPAIAALIMSMESVFAALFGWLILNEMLSPRELGGCALMLAAVILSQLSDN
ncbi:MAG: DMT family transporter [Syntrophomonadaceae bacterium]|nr:DMT family transporter [Syntrophomonadaceae bacterium]